MLPNPAPSDKTLKAYALALLTQQELTASQLQQKLQAKGATAQQIQNLLTEFKQRGYQSDERAAEIQARRMSRQGKGSLRIKQQLQQLQVDENIIQEQIENTDWLLQALDVRRKKFGTLPPADAKQKAKQLRFLQYRGFDIDVCIKAVAYQWSEENDQ